MNDSAPLVSILMSVYNGQRYLAEAIESMLAQTFTDFEFIIIDDASSDNTWQILETYIQRDARLILIRNQENIGLTRSLNKGLARARGKYVARQDADDVALPQRLEVQVSYLEKHPQVVLVSCNLDVIDDQGHTVRQFLRACEPLFVSWFLLFSNHLAGHSQVLFRKETVDELGGYSDTCRFSQDYELWLRLDQVGEIAILPEILQRWRQHENSISGTVRQEQDEYQLRISQQYLSALIGQDLGLELIAELKAFWGGKFPNVSRLSSLHSLIKQIYLAFLQKKNAHNHVDPQFPKRLRNLIGGQFLFWAQVLGFLRSPLSKLKVSFYALNWYPVGFAIFWATYPWFVLESRLAAISHWLLRRASTTSSNPKMV